MRAGPVHAYCCRLGVALLTGTFVACGDAEPEPQFQVPPTLADGVVHPIPDSLESTRRPDLVREIELPSDVSPPPRYQALAHFDSASALGAIDGPEESILGELTDAAVTGDDRILLLDESFGVVRMLTSALEPIRRIGAPGDGPGEFRAPIGIVGNASGDVTVADERGLRLEHFPSDTLRGPARTPFPGQPLDLCRIGDRFFVFGPHILVSDSGAVIPTVAMVHEVDTASTSFVRSFSTPYHAVTDINVVQYIAVGRVACDAIAGGRVFAGYSSLGEVHALTADGALRWIARLTDFSIMRFIRAEGVSGPDPTVRVMDRITDLTLIAPDVLSVQVLSLDRSTSPATRSHRTYLLDPETGELLGGFRAGHRVLGGGLGLAVLYRAEPFPQVTVVRFD